MEPGFVISRSLELFNYLFALATSKLIEKENFNTILAVLFFILKYTTKISLIDIINTISIRRAHLLCESQQKEKRPSNNAKNHKQ